MTWNDDRKRGTQVRVNFNADRQTYEQLKVLAAASGLTISAVFRDWTRYIVATGRLLPDEVTADAIPREEVAPSREGMSIDCAGTEWDPKSGPWAVAGTGWKKRKDEDMPAIVWYETRADDELDDWTGPGTPSFGAEG